ncbi:hypothetical protein ACFV0L_18430 [Streptosporangium canum]|uniref:hypothetical protein n=1 Tax=Streptosporangium canum TaxID=324952 RepID=UPI0036873BB3
MTDPEADVLEGVVILRQDRQLAVLQQTYPGWHITHDPLLGHWAAIRRAPLTSREKEGGVKYTITHPAPEALSSALACQVELAHTYRPRHRS